MKRKYCEKYISAKEGRELIRIIKAGYKGPLTIEKIAFLADPFSEDVQTKWFQKMHAAVVAGELQATRCDA